jgi:hypothetical protein
MKANVQCKQCKGYETRKEGMKGGLYMMTCLVMRYATSTLFFVVDFVTFW